MKHIISLFLFLLLITSCSSDGIILNDFNLVCSVKNPIENLSWLNSEIDLLNNDEGIYNYVIQTKHNSQTVFVFADCNPLANSVFIVKNCEGNNIGIIGTGEQDIPPMALDNGIVIWKAENSECDF